MFGFGWVRIAPLIGQQKAAIRRKEYLGGVAGFGPGISHAGCSASVLHKAKPSPPAASNRPVRLKANALVYAAPAENRACSRRVNSPCADACGSGAGD